MTIDIVTSMLDCGVHHAHRVLLEYKFPEMSGFYHLHVVDDNEPDLVVGVKFNTEEEKDIILSNMKRLAQEFSCTAIMFGCEAWMESPDLERFEGIVFVATDGVTTQGRCLVINRGADGQIASLDPGPDEAHIALCPLVEGIINFTIH